MIGPSLCPETGTSILFNVLVDQMRARGVIVHTVPIPRGGRNPLAKPLKFLGVLLRTIRWAPHVDVISAHVPTPQLANVAFASLMIARIFRRAFVLRKFGGMDTSALRLHARFLAEQTLKRSSVSFVEAKEQCAEIGEKVSTSTFWYPNHRHKPEREPERSWRGGRFVYIGRVQREKGIEEILEASTRLNRRCCVDIYGPCGKEVTPELFRQSTCVHYRGVVENREIPSVLSEYDALLLPTYWEGEGYPGVVIEAFQVGLPVIATEWKFIPEIVDETCGILVKPRDAEDLRRAMNRLAADTDLAQRLRVGALVKGEEFSAEKWADLFIRVCRIACETPGQVAERQQRIKGLYAELQLVMENRPGWGGDSPRPSRPWRKTCPRKAAST